MSVVALEFQFHLATLILLYFEQGKIGLFSQMNNLLSSHHLGCLSLYSSCALTALRRWLDMVSELSNELVHRSGSFPGEGLFLALWLK